MEKVVVAFLAGCCAAVAIVWFMGSQPNNMLDAMRRVEQSQGR